MIKKPSRDRSSKLSTNSRVTPRSSFRMSVVSSQLNGDPGDNSPGVKKVRRC